MSSLRINFSASLICEYISLFVKSSNFLLFFKYPANSRNFAPALLLAISSLLIICLKVIFSSILQIKSVFVLFWAILFISSSVIYFYPSNKACWIAFDTENLTILKNFAKISHKLTTSNMLYINNRWKSRFVSPIKSFGRFYCFKFYSASSNPCGLFTLLNSLKFVSPFFFFSYFLFGLFTSKISLFFN